MLPHCFERYCSFSKFFNVPRIIVYLCVDCNCAATLRIFMCLVNHTHNFISISTKKKTKKKKEEKEEGKWNILFDRSDNC